MPHTTDSVIIRNADLNDAAAIAGLSEQLGYPAAEGQINERLALILRRGDNAVFVAASQGKIVGWAHVVGQMFLESPPFAELTGLIVDCDARRHGIGRCLVEACAQWAQDHRCRQIRVRSNVVRQEAHQFYSDVGFTQIKTQAVFAMTLTSP